MVEIWGVRKERNVNMPEGNLDIEVGGELLE
jgi:hypothetical protein